MAVSALSARRSPLDRDRHPRLRPLVLGLGAFVALALVVHALYAVLGLGRQYGIGPAGDVLLASGQIACGVLCITRARVAASGRGAWRALGIGVVVWALGDVLLRHGGLIGEPAERAVARGLWLAAYPAAFVGLLVMARERLQRLSPAVWLDGLAAGLASAALAAALVLQPLREVAPDPLTAVLYPLGDLVLVGLVVGTLALAGWRPDRSLLLLGAGLLLAAMSDSLLLLGSTSVPYVEGTLLATLRLAAAALVALAAWDVPGRVIVLRPERLATLPFPSLSVLVALGLLVYGNLAALGRAALVLATLAVLAGAARYAVALGEVRLLAGVQRDATTDYLTGLPNRRWLNASLDAMLEGCRRRGQSLGLLVADLDGFKELNDTLGHHAGDVLLRDVAHVLERSLDNEGTLARLGGDEFAVVMPAANAAEARAAGERARAALAPSFEVEGMAVHVQASVGVALFPEHADDGETLLRRADVAMYQAKDEGHGVALYASERDPHSRTRLDLLGQLPRAIEGGELLLHYQPQCMLATGEVAGVEALLRWEHPRLGLVQPDRFLPLTERTALMRPLTLRVLEAALDQSRRWALDGFRAPLAVNLAVPNLLDSRLPADVARLLEGAGVEPGRLKLEITETTIMSDPARSARVLAELADMGVGLSIDDFGTGHSSLEHLRWLPVGELKIDRSFVIDLVPDGTGAAIVRSVAELGQRLGLRVVAEGVERASVLNLVYLLGCDMAQGYHLSPPLSPAGLDRWLEGSGVAVAASDP